MSEPSEVRFTRLYRGDPRRIANVDVLDPRTVEIVIEKVRESSQGDLLAYRESEIDGLWSLADMAVKEGYPAAEKWLALLWSAHDLVGAGEREQAGVALEELRDLLVADSWTRESGSRDPSTT